MLTAIGLARPRRADGGQRRGERDRERSREKRERARSRIVEHPDKTLERGKAQSNGRKSHDTETVDETRPIHHAALGS